MHHVHGNIPFCYLKLLWEITNFNETFSNYGGENADSSGLKITHLLVKYSLLTVQCKMDVTKSAVTTTVFTTEHKRFIKCLCVNKKCKTKCLIKVFPDRGWNFGGL